VNVTAAVAALLGRYTALDPEVAGVIARIVAVVIALALLVVLYRILVGLVQRLLRPRPGLAAQSPLGQRSRTLGSLLVNVIRWVVAFIGLVVVLRELGVDVQAVLVSAGVVGLAVGLGAQSLIRDLITGIFLLFEGLIGVGDVVQVGSVTGTVESIGLRVTQLRQIDGALRVIPNGLLTEFTNLSAGWARVIVDVGVHGDVPVDRALAVLRQVGEDWAAATGVARDEPRSQGIMRFSGADLVLRLMVTVDPAERFDAEIELRRRIKEAFAREQWQPLGT
jgi:small conductance mechanosensitive channel